LAHDLHYPRLNAISWDQSAKGPRELLVNRQSEIREMPISLPASPIRFSLKSVLAATDFSDTSQQPLDHALAIARHFGAKFYLAHVVSGLAYTLAGPDALELASEAAERDLLLFEHQLVENGWLDGADHESLVRKGIVWEELQSIISQNHIDLVVLGTHARRGLGRMLLGSVAEAVFRHANCPVLTVGPNSSPFVFGSASHRFLFATDFGEGSLRALPHAISFANSLGAKLTLLHVVPVKPVAECSSRNVVLSPDIVRVACLRRIEQLLAHQELAHPPECLVQFGVPSERILRTATEIKADLVFLGLHRSTRVASLQMRWATAYEVVCGASCPVLTSRTQ
jgi:nucleotide-binding universal stress UspA family protein